MVILREFGVGYLCVITATDDRNIFGSKFGTQTLKRAAFCCSSACTSAGIKPEN